MIEKGKGSLRNVLKVGTPECAVFCAVIAMALALLLLTLGFWKTLLAVVIVCAGAFIGGVKDKKEFISRIVNRLFPPKTAVPYRTSETDAEQVEDMRKAAGEQAVGTEEQPAADAPEIAEPDTQDEE